MLSPDVQKRLDAALQTQASYQPNADVGEILQDKTLVMCVGPAAIGKSFIMNRAVELDADFKRVPVFTTRDPRPDDEPGMFRYLEHNDKNVSALLDKFDRGELVNFAIHPSTGRIYGTTTEDYPGKYNLLPTLSGAVAQLENLPFAETHIIGFTSRVWADWFLKRYPENSDEKQKRLQEAVSSLEWLLTTPNVTWLENQPERGSETARKMISIVKYKEQGSQPVRDIAREMAEQAKEML